MEHWRELALHKDVFVCAPDWDRYYALDVSGALRILTVRFEGQLIGYLFALYVTHPHSMSTHVARVDTYWLDPVHRQGWTGVRMFKELLRQSKEWGSLFVVASIECHFMGMRAGKLLERLGFEQTEIVYSRKL
jgi:GNAT superfamily N-acetyltransferase